MQPREIDLQVALALGARIEDTNELVGDANFRPYGFHFIDANGVNTGWWKEEQELKDGRVGNALPHYSTDLTAAFIVGETLWLDGWGVQKVRELEDGTDWVTHWEAGPMHSHWTDEMGIEVKEIDPLAEADTPAMAICLAALKSKGVEVGG